MNYADYVAFCAIPRKNTHFKMVDFGFFGSPIAANSYVMLRMLGLTGWYFLGMFLICVASMEIIHKSSLILTFHDLLIRWILFSTKSIILYVLVPV